MKRVTFTINDHSDRMNLLEAFESNGYDATVKVETQYIPPRCVVIVEVEDFEIEGKEVDENG